MRKHIVLFYLIILSASCFAQTVTKTVGIVYTAGAPAHAPAAKVGSQVAIDTATWKWYEYNGSAWIASGDRIQSISGCSAPNYTPTKYQSRLVINACTAGQGGPELYYYTGSVWLQINEGQTYTAGSGISIAGDQISASDTSPTNEIQTLSIVGSNLSISSGNTVSLPATGLTSLNGLTGGTQTFSTGTSGTDFGISSSGTAHTFNFPSASASNRGLLTSADWSVFNAKIGGSGSSGRVGIWNGPASQTSSADLTFISNNLNITGDGTFGLNISSGGLTINRSTISFFDINNTQGGATSWRVGSDNSNLTDAFTIARKTGGFLYALNISNTGNVGMGVNTGSIGGRVHIKGSTTDNTATALLVQNSAGGSILNTRNDGKTTLTGSTGYNQLNLATTYTPTGTADALGNTGDTAWDANYFYIKTAAGWKRAALSTF